MFLPTVVKKVFSPGKISTVLIILLSLLFYKAFNNVSDINIEGFDDVSLQTKLDNKNYSVSKEYTNVYYRSFKENDHGLSVKVVTRGPEDLIEKITLRLTFENTEACYNSFNKMINKYYEKHDLINYLWFDSFHDVNERTININEHCKKGFISRDKLIYLKVHISSEVENEKYTILFEKQKNEKLINGLNI